VYDFGGTFDVALMRVRNGLIQVVNNNGDNFLGGKLIDWDLVAKCLAPALADQYSLPDFNRGNPRWDNPLGRLKFEVEKAKIEVCRTHQPVEIYVECLCEDANGKAVEVVYTLTPQEVEDIGHPYVARTLDLSRRTLEEKGLRGSSLDRVLMVGGSTLNPWVRKAVESELGATLGFGIDPVTVVARGAAIFASTLAIPSSRDGQPNKPPCPQTIGIELEDGTVAPIIRKGQPLPARGEHDRRTAVALRAGHPEDRIRIPVVEGEHPRFERNRLIGELIIKGSDVRKDLPAGSLIEVTLKLDTPLKIEFSVYVPRLDEEFQPDFEFHRDVP
jgi:molecular chaperone DnaK (HSP70)